MANMKTALNKVAYENMCVISEEIGLPPKHSRIAKIPAALHSLVKERLSSLYPAGLYHHQAAGIGLGLTGRSLCVATPTASGKTVIFTAISTSVLLDNPGTAILALYPAKALIHDQERKWHDATKNTGIETVIIHGGVERKTRIELLKKGRIVLMTPDVLHAWLLANLDEPVIRLFLGTLKLIILDEAHIYDGVFGTNMAYLLRRLRAVSGANQVLASSATIGEPVSFLKKLTGLDCDLIGLNEDGTATPAKTIMLCRVSQRAVGPFLRGLVKELRGHDVGRFLFFVDSRKRVEELASTVMQFSSQNSGEEEAEVVHEGEDTLDADQVIDLAQKYSVLPYRAGYEETDRAQIQTALTNGTLRGVISTSALELGIDIGEITLVVNLGTPPTIKSFWQRAGRAGRRSEGYVLLLDTDGRIAELGLDRYLQQSPESNWFYMENEYLQYANALCAADEYQQASQPLYSNVPLSDMPESFRDFLENEITPTRPIPHELYPLKQQAVASGHPHYAFPVRTSIEKSYKVECSHLPGQGLGSLTYSQLLREAFPAALYRYMGRPYRIWDLKHAQGRVIAGNAKSYGVTRPTSQTMVFPKFTDEIYFLKKSDDSFICECCVQVSLRVIGFIEQFGNSKNEVKYEPGCRYAQKPLANYYDTTGVCFFFREDDLQREALGRYIASAFCRICAVQDRDVSSGLFVCSNMSPIGQGQIRGIAVFDTTVGSLRLTRQIPERLEEILLEGIRMAREAEANKIAEGLALLLKKADELKKQDIHSLGSVALSTDHNGGWITVVASNQAAICHDGVSHINEEVIVLGYLYTPQGIRYKLKHPRDGVQWQVTANMIHPINGNTQLEQYNINTGETRASSG